MEINTRALDGGVPNIIQNELIDISEGAKGNHFKEVLFPVINFIHHKNHAIRILHFSFI